MLIIIIYYFLKFLLCDSWLGVCGDECGRVAVAEAPRTEELSVTRAAVDLLVGAVAR